MRLIIIYSFLLVTLIWRINYCQAQSHEWLAEEFTGSTFMDFFKVKGKWYGAISTGAMFTYNPDTEYRLELYEFNFDTPGVPGFSLEKVAILSSEDSISTIAIDYINETSVWIIVQSIFIAEGHQDYRILLCNEDFDVLREETIDTLGYPLGFHIASKNGVTYILGSLIGPPRDELFFIKYDHLYPDSLPRIQITQASPKPMFWITSMDIDDLYSNMVVFYFNGIAVLDSNLYQVERFDHFSHIKTYHHGSVIDVGDNVYSHGCYKLDTDLPFRNLVLNKYDTSFVILNRDTLGYVGQDNYPFVISSIDYQNDELLVGAHLDGPYNFFDVASHVKKFYLAKYDANLNQIWYKEFGGDRAYWFYGVKFIDNGEVLAYGAITDSIDGQRYAYVLHLDQNGDILSSTTIPDIAQKIKIVNPGSEFLQIINPELEADKIQLYDFNGRIHLQRDLVSDLNIIAVAGLPPGCYPYVLSKDGKHVKSGKWVKAH